MESAWKFTVFSPWHPMAPHVVAPGFFCRMVSSRGGRAQVDGGDHKRGTQQPLYSQAMWMCGMCQDIRTNTCCWFANKHRCTWHKSGKTGASVLVRLANKKHHEKGCRVAGWETQQTGRCYSSIARPITTGNATRDFRSKFQVNHGPAGGVPNGMG